MGKFDTKTDNYFDDNYHFADIWNGFLYNGKQIIKADELLEADRILTSNPKSSSFTNISDKSKLWNGKQLRLLLLENQSYIDYHMIIRTMSLECNSYQKQWKSLKRQHQINKDLRDDEYLSGMKKGEHFIPVITLVINFSNRKWDAARTLYDIIDLKDDDIIKNYISNYHMNLYDYHDYDNFEMFKTTLKNIFEVARYSNDEESLEKCLQKDSRYKHLDEDTIRIINDINSVKVEIIGGYGNMCKAFEDHKLSGVKEGLKEGKRTVLIALVNDGDITIEKAAEKMEVSVDEFKKMMNE